jgi:hypothetical protein
VEVDGDIQTEWQAPSSVLDGEVDGEVVGWLMTPRRKSEANLDGLSIRNVRPAAQNCTNQQSESRVNRICISICDGVNGVLDLTFEFDSTNTRH